MRTITALITSAAVAAVGALSIAATPTAGATSGGTAWVTSEADSGPRTLRAALASGAQSIVIHPSVDVIELASTLTGTTSVRIHGAGTIIDAGGVGIGLAITAGPGATGTFDVGITNLTVVGAGDHGIYVTDDQDGDLDAAGTGTPASLSVSLLGVAVDDVGGGAFDRDGVRVDERDDGTLGFTATGCRFARAGADGVELDETGAGGVTFNVKLSTFDANGPLNPDDLDDGIDVDEIGDGDVVGTVQLSSFLANHDEGLDINEDGLGSIDVDLVAITVRDTVDGDGIAFEEHGDGGVTVELRASNGVGNTGDGFEVAEDGNGDVAAEIVASTLVENDKGVDVEELDAGNASVSVRATRITDGTGDGFQIAEDGDGVIVAELLASTLTRNVKGVDLDEDGPGSGSTLKRRASTVAGNTEDLDLDDVTEI